MSYKRKKYERDKKYRNRGLKTPRNIREDGFSPKDLSEITKSHWEKLKKLQEEDAA